MNWLPPAGAALAVFAGAGWWLRRRYLTVTVDGPSMLPAYRPGERLLVRRATSGAALRPGQVVVVGGQPGWVVKRVAAVPGDPVPGDVAPALRGDQSTRVPAGRLVLLGDNPGQSYDSRQLGYFRTDRLLGVVLRRMPLGRPGPPVPNPAPPTGRQAAAA